MPEPVSKQQIDQAVAGWENLLPENADPGYLVGGGEARAARIQGLRSFADLMEARPDLPMPSRLQVPDFLRGTVWEMTAQLDYVGELLDQSAEESLTGSGTRTVNREFGPVRYRIVAVAPYEGSSRAAAFSVGQEVQLTGDAAHMAETVRLARTGTVVGVEAAPDGACTYAVHFPGRVGTQRGWTESALTKARSFEPFVIWSGEVTSLQAAEELLIERGAEIRLRALSARQPSDALLSEHEFLTEKVARACGLSDGELLHQIQPQVEEKVRTHVTARGLEPPPIAPELAASDRHTVAAALKDVPAQDDDQQPSREPAITRARGKER